MAIAFVAIGVIGFSTTFFIPLARGSFQAPWIMHVHGALFFAWLLLFVVQSQLVQMRRVNQHRRMGWIGAGLAAAMAVSGVAVAFVVTRRDLAAGLGDFARGQLVNIIIEMVVFVSFVAAAVYFRRKREIHARLLLLGTISILGPAWLRFRHFLPMVPNPFVSFSIVADSLVLIAMLHDYRAHGRVHRVYLTAGIALLVVHFIELAFSESELWMRIARVLLQE